MAPTNDAASLDAVFDRFFDEAALPLPESDAGGGAFGRWMLDGDGLPGYEYTLDHARDSRARYRVSAGESADHWHQVGNDRITALAHNEGYVEAVAWDRAGRYLNRWDSCRGRYAGGFKFLKTEGRVFSTLWSHLPPGAQRRYFGCGYCTKSTRVDGWVLEERIEAPPGDIPAVLSETRLANLGSTSRRIVLVEFWAADLYFLLPAPVMTHRLAVWAHRWRVWFNRHFRMHAGVDQDAHLCWARWEARHPRRIPPRDRPTWGDYHPHAAFLACMDDPLPPEWAVDPNLFFGDAGLAAPPGIDGAADGIPVNGRCARRHAAVFAVRREFLLQPGQTVRVRYLYGYAPPDRIAETAAACRAAVQGAKRRVQMEFHASDVPWLARESVWHSHCLQANTLYQESVGLHVVDQGSAYSMLHGALGAHRDFALTALPMVYLRPALAREMLLYSMRAQDARTGALPYAHVGFGKCSGAGVHARSSDLDLFFLWAAAEYLGATRDFSLLEDTIAFHSGGKPRLDSGMAHLHAAFDHLRNRVGIGPHGILRCGTGDWNDALAAYSRRKWTTIRNGESLLNAGLAALALPLLADVIEPSDPAFSGALRAFAGEQARAARALWTGRWWARGYTGVGDALLGADHLFLDCQAFPVLAGLTTPDERARLFAAVQECLVGPQPAGASCLWPPMCGFLLEPGADTNGGTWAAVDAWTAWAWSEHDARAGWDFFLRTTLKQRAEAYPDLWYGIWSGPDAYNAHYHSRPGETFYHVATPMTDFPVMNANRHAGPLWNLITLAGIRPRGDTLFFRPRLPFSHFAFRSPLTGIAYHHGMCRGYYVPVTQNTFSFAVTLPEGVPPDSARLLVDGVPAAFDRRDGCCRFRAAGKPGVPLRWEIRPA